ncbi:Hypothetical protein KK9_0439 [Borreliella garinii BgVir]|nr:Hypothetical protein KK9_0439 [Borreliella garinii BgVir]
MYNGRDLDKTASDKSEEDENASRSSWSLSPGQHLLQWSLQSGAKQ